MSPNATSATCSKRKPPALSIAPTVESSASPLPELFSEIASNVLVASGIVVSHAAVEPEGADYAAVTFLLDSKPTLFRVAKTTPTKVGQFVTVWKRSEHGPIRPIDDADGVELLLVHVSDAPGKHRGLFIFSTSALRSNGVFSSAGVDGKRAFRVYAPWVVTTNATAQRAQRWQADSFLPFEARTGNAPAIQFDAELLKQLLQK